MYRISTDPTDEANKKLGKNTVRPTRGQRYLSGRRSMSRMRLRMTRDNAPKTDESMGPAKDGTPMSFRTGMRITWRNVGSGGSTIRISPSELSLQKRKKNPLPVVERASILPIFQKKWSRIAADKKRTSVHKKIVQFSNFLGLGVSANSLRLYSWGRSFLLGVLCDSKVVLILLLLLRFVPDQLELQPDR